ncbi:FtsX-like permease family protein [Pseudobacteriovorax antillogorgiicola]|uniref:Putative ABC transport system permease protein n=1 Tax=Pseudobacteriovorax antillogorgiicola TaxID=1513793 RepID=A0A1Y6BS45_9BACT|nr:FtsX-like permease family protein [Pseudobacteriovorax antillogorgiicola]TCS54571.1 putative ABC transport system permease protein [Pseudobacteriovorax antillogorgiicola]SMF18066.1 putative ABC transport system permease protein [Pseudobacteriovorax antillogorgiicola]
MQLKFSLLNVSRNRRRSLVCLISIAVSVFGLYFLDGFFTGLIAMHRENSIHSRFGHGQIFQKGYYDQSHAKPWQHWIENPEEVMTKVLEHPHVEQVFPRVQFFSLLSNGEMSVAGRGMGVRGKEEESFFNKMNIVEGSVLSDHDDGIVIGIGLAKALGVKVGDPVTVVGNTIYGSINALDLKVVGIFHMGLKEADDMLFQVQLDQAQTLLDTKKVESISLGNTSHLVWDQVEGFVEKSFPVLEARSVNVLDKIWAENGENFLTALLNIFRLVFLGVISLSIYNSSANTVLERTRELGMLRANGLSGSLLVKLMTLESAFLAIAGAAIGLLLTLLVTQIFADGVPMPPTPGTNRELPVVIQLEWLDGFLAVGLGVGVSILASMSASLQVLFLPISKALRSLS